jgi:tetratricopeptide (TPR) repeat protein
MKHCRLILLIAILPLLQAAGNPMEQGRQALADQLWEIAAFRFTEALADPKLEPSPRAEATIGLAHAWIRNGNTEQALAILGKPPASSHPEAPYWKAMALAASGRFTDAVTLLTPLAADPTHPRCHEAAFTCSSLQLSLKQPEAALETLASYAAIAPPTAAAQANLRQAAILLDLNQPAKAREILPPNDTLTPQDLHHAEYIQACLLLAEQKYPEAASAFSLILNQTQSQPLSRHHAAILGLADATALPGDTTTASETLLDFIQKNPDSPALDAIFERLVRWLPPTPTITHPVIERLRQWIPPTPLPTTGIIAAGPSNAVSAWPKTLPPDDLAAFSLFTRATGLHQTGDPTARAEARTLITRLRLEHAEHFLANRALILTARWLMEEQKLQQAFTILDTIRETAPSPLLRGESAFIKAHAAYQSGDHEKAARLFDEATRDLSSTASSSSAAFNSAIARLHLGQPITTIATENPDLAPDLQLEQALANTDPAASLAAIESFLKLHPTHPRTPEARLAAAEAALHTSPPDPSLAKAQLDTLAATPESLSTLPTPRIDLARLRITDLAQNPTATISAARTFLKAHPTDPAAAEASLTLGRNLFQSGDYNDARLVLEKLATTDTNPTRAQASWLLAARSAALVSTAQSKNEALALFDKAIAINGPLTPGATLEKTRHLIDLNLLPEAATFIRKYFDSLPPDDPLRLPAGLLYGEATYAQGGGNPASLTNALAIYDTLLTHAKSQPAILHRLQYLRGMTLEQLPNPKNPELKREAEAFDAYHSVLANATNPPAEWEYFERCSLRALALLEKAQRWQAAIKLAEKIATFNGPGAPNAADRAKQLRLKHMIWED